MKQVGVRELKASASEIIRAVRERQARYVITYRGRPVGLLLPLKGATPLPEGLEEEEAIWEDLERLGEEIGRGWASPLTGAELLSEMRR
jgi:prevent-host-death family protein